MYFYGVLFVMFQEGERQNLMTVLIVDRHAIALDDLLSDRNA